MSNLQQRKNSKNIFYTKPVLVFLFLIVLFFVWGVVGFVGKMVTTIENKRIVENKVKNLQIEKEQLSADIAKLKTDEGVEENIRKKFGLAKEGENMIIVIEDQNPVSLGEVKKPGFFSFFTDLFK